MALALGGCASLGNPGPEATTDGGVVPAAWLAPLPHGGQAVELARWWEQFDDPLLTQLIANAQAVSPTLAAARSRIEQARARRVAAGAALLPGVNATASASRGQQDLSFPLGTALSAGLQAGWELDLFGRNQAARSAADERLIGAEAGWHEARVALAAETGSAYVALRACEAQLEQTQLDSRSRSETARLTDLSARAGFQPPAAAALARASAAQGRSNEAQQRTRCGLDLNALAALTGMSGAALRAALEPARARLPGPALLDVPAVPAEALAQRPDVYRAARDVLAAAGDAAQADADRYPRITLAGSVGAARFDTSAASLSGPLWTLGPVSVSLPIFDAGTRRANVAAARARYDEALIAYGARLRDAIREVEDALSSLAGTAARDQDAQIAAASFLESFRATEARHRGGLASLFELEDARRSAVLAQSTLVDLQRERVTAWISLYRALGGGWRRPEVVGTEAVGSKRKAASRPSGAASTAPGAASRPGVGSALSPATLRPARGAR